MGRNVFGQWIRHGVFVVMVAGVAGCQGMHHKNSVVASNEPALMPSDGTTVVVAPPPERADGWAERHPLVMKPRQYYDNTQGNKLVKGAAATVIGVPAGLMGEMRQIVVGRAPNRPSPVFSTEEPGGIVTGSTAP
jgi:hypothetical protein